MLRNYTIFGINGNRWSKTVQLQYEGNIKIRRLEKEMGGYEL